MSFVAAAVVGAGVVGAVVSSGASKSAANQAAATSTANTAANNALAQQTYADNKATLAPFVQQGGAATSYINQLLGISQPGSTLPTGTASAAYGAYKASTGYNTRLAEGTQAVTNNKAVSGLLNSGSALKDLTKYGQDYATADYSNYLNQLTGQQGVGLSAASAQAGVSNSYSANVQANNNTNSTNQANAAIAKANGTTNAIQGVLGTAGYLAGIKAGTPTYTTI